MNKNVLACYRENWQLTFYLCLQAQVALQIWWYFLLSSSWICTLYDPLLVKIYNLLQKCKIIWNNLQKYLVLSAEWPVLHDHLILIELFQYLQHYTLALLSVAQYLESIISSISSILSTARIQLFAFKVKSFKRLVIY